MKHLSELRCSSNLPTDFFCQLSQICHNLRSISIRFDGDHVSKGLKELISLQNNLKNLTLTARDEGSWTNIIPALTKRSNTVTKLHLYYDSYKNVIHSYNLPVSFVSLFLNLQEIIFSFTYQHSLDFKELQHFNFPNLQILKFIEQCPKPEYLSKFLENNGKTLKKFYIDINMNTSISTIAKFCPNLKSLFVIFGHSEVDNLKTIFISCQYLESIKMYCGKPYLTEREVLKTVVNHSPSNFCELKIYNCSNLDFISSEDLESFFITWKNRTPTKLLTLIIIKPGYNPGYSSINEKNMTIIEKYENLGIIKLKVKKYEENQREEQEYED